MTRTEKSPAFRYWRAADRGPTVRERKILDRIAASGGLYCTPRHSGFSYRLAADGTAVRSDIVAKFVALSWLAPDPDAPPLFPEIAPPQRYLVAPAWRPR